MTSEGECNRMRVPEDSLKLIISLKVPFPKASFILLQKIHSFSSPGKTVGTIRIVYSVPAQYFFFLFTDFSFPRHAG